MIKYIKLICGFCFFVLIVSCEDNLNPNGQLKEIYVLNCVVRGDTTYQVATISKSYFPADGTTSGVNDDNSIKGAVLRMWSNDKVGIFKDTSVFLSTEQKPYSFYYANSFQPDEKSDLVIEAILPDGKKLTSSTTVPSKAAFISDACDDTISSNIKLLRFYWNSQRETPVFSIKLKIYYLHLENNQYVQKYFVVPKEYIEKDNKIYAVYPELTNNLLYEVNIATINQAMKEISGDDMNKLNYSITGAVLEVLSLDDELSKYYYSTNRGVDSYSINLDETDYTNIHGGAGIFGVTIRSNWKIRFTREYVDKFGYEPFF